MSSRSKDIKKGVPIEILLLKILLWIYIILCIVIAGFNYGLSSNVSPSTAELFTKIWHIYENQAKTLFIAAASILTLRVLRSSKHAEMRKKNLLGFFVAALVVHIVMPVVLRNSEVYFFVMPLPWTTVPIQLMDSQTAFYLSRVSVWGLGGISSVLVFYAVYSAIVFFGTLLFGRRFQCSTICLFNGFVAELFSPALPLVGKRRPFGKKALQAITALKGLFFAAALFFTLWWGLSLIGITDASMGGTVAKIENYKYLLGELFAAMFFWIAISGRTYCYYCPLGTILSFLSKAGGQKIKTDNTQCIQCGKCDQVCPMSIDVKKHAKSGSPVFSARCVGCGHCVDVCPTKTLSYSTSFLGLINKES